MYSSKRSCLSCNVQCDSLSDLRKHVVMEHSSAMFTPAMKDKFVEEAICIWTDNNPGQPREWLFDEPAPVDDLIRVFGPTDPRAYIGPNVIEQTQETALHMK